MNAACAYRDVRRASLAEGATPYQLTLMLFDGAIARIETARDLTAPEETEVRRRALDRALAIVHELQGALRDPETNELSSRLFMLYAYIGERLLEGTRSRDSAPLDEAAMLLGTVREGWMDIDPGAVAA